jgi:hypothetical protein
MSIEIVNEVIKFKAYPEDIEVEYRSDSFRPNRVSEAFADAVDKDLSGLIVDDVGAGGGTIAIIEGKRNAKEVRAIEKAHPNYCLLEGNIKRNNLVGKVIPFEGAFFDPILTLPPADIITADVSGIPEIVGRALGWYPEGIPTGGDKGTEITCELLRRAPYHIKKNGKLYFPTADDLLDAEEILEIARKNFEVVDNALCSAEQLREWNRKATESNGRLWKSPEYVWFPLKEEDMSNLERAYKGNIPNTIHIQEVKGHYFWRGRIHVAMGPKV